MSALPELTEAVKTGNRNSARELTTAALERGDDPEQVLDAMVEAMDDIGKRFQRNEVFVPEMLIAARAMKEAMSVLEPSLVKAGIKPKFNCVIGTVQGDLHDIGKNLVAMMWKGANFGVVDLGTNVTPERFVEAIREHEAQVVGISALLTTTMPAMKTIIDAIRAEGMDDVKVVIGGAPITKEFADQIGADGFAADAASAVECVRELVPA